MFYNKSKHVKKRRTRKGNRYEWHNDCPDTSEKILKQIGLDGYFDAVSDGTNITKSKPDPEVFIKAAEMVEEKPENCLVVEDALAGIDAAYAGGFISAGIGDAASHKYVTYPIHTFSDLLSIDKL